MHPMVKQKYNSLWCFIVFLFSKQSWIQISKVRIDHALCLKYFRKLFDSTKCDVTTFFPKYFVELLHIYQICIVRLYLWKFGICITWSELSSHYHAYLWSDCTFPLKNLVSFIIFEIIFHVPVTSKNLFGVG